MFVRAWLFTKHCWGRGTIDGLHELACMITCDIAVDFMNNCGGWLLPFERARFLPSLGKHLTVARFVVITIKTPTPHSLPSELIDVIFLRVAMDTYSNPRIVPVTESLRVGGFGAATCVSPFGLRQLSSTSSYLNVAFLLTP